MLSLFVNKVFEAENGQEALKIFHQEKLLSAMRLNLVNYLEKPLQFGELIQALNEAITKLAEQGKLRSVIVKGVEYDYVNKSLIIHGNKEVLTKNEYLFIEILLSKRATLVPSKLIEESLYKGGVTSNTLRNMVYRLRKKIPSELITTVKDIGYILG